MFKKISLIVLLASIVLIPLITNAGLVPCGEEGNPCHFCHFFVLLDNIIDFVLFKIVPPLAILMLVIGGIMFVGATLEFLPGGPSLLSDAKKLMTSVIIGLIIIYGGWIIVNLFFQVIGVAEWTGLQEGWFQIPCE